MLGGSSASYSLQDFDLSGIRVIAVRGEIDLVTSRDLFRAFVAVADRHIKPILLDFSEVGYIDAQGVHALEAFAVYVQPQQRRIAMVASSYPVHRIFEVLEVAKSIPWFDTQEAAVDFLSSEGA